jgi:hypothetical protein
MLKAMLVVLQDTRNQRCCEPKGFLMLYNLILLLSIGSTVLACALLDKDLPNHKLHSTHPTGVCSHESF